MAVSTDNAIDGPYTANGSTTVFPFTFTAPSTSDVSVLLIDADGNETTADDYTVTLTNGGGGSVEFDDAPATGFSIYVLLDPDFTQDVEFEQGGPWLARAVNAANDKAAARDQWLKARIELLTSSAMLDASARAGRFSAWDAEGNPVTSSGTGADAGLRTDLAASGGAALAGFLQSGTGAVARTVLEKARESVSPRDFGAVGDGEADDSAAVERAIATGRNVNLAGMSYGVSNIAGFANNQRIHNGKLVKYGTDIEPMVLLPDASEGVWFDGVEFDGNRDAFNDGNGVPAILGYLTRSFRATDCYFHDIIDAGVKLRNAMGVVVDGCRFIDCIENAIELQIYVNDPRTALPYTGEHPVLCGNHRITNNHIEGSTRVEDVGTGIVDACGVLIASVNGSYPPRNCIVSGNTIIDCLRGIWTEANVANTEALDLTIQGNTIQGGVNGGTADGIYCKGGIGIIGAKGATIKGNTIRNPGNYDAVGNDTACIYVSASNGVTTNDSILIEGNTLFDDTGGGSRTKYGLVLTLGSKVQVRNNSISGMRIAPMNINSSLVTDLRIEGNGGASLDHSWGNVVKFSFALQNIPASSTVNMPMVGETGIDKIPLPCPGRVVAAVVRQSAAGTGAWSYIVKLDGTAQTSLNITQADMGGGAIDAYKSRSTESAAQYAAGKRLEVEITTDGSWTNTCDAAVDVWLDIGMKQ